MLKVIRNLSLVLCLLVLVMSTSGLNENVSASSHPGVAVTSGTSGNIDNTGKTKTATTATMTIPANHLALLWVGTTFGISGPPTITDPLRSWQMVATGGPNSGNRRVTLFKSLADVETTGNVKFTNSGGRSTTWAWSAVEYPATQVVQYKYNDATQTFQNSGLIILPSTSGNGGFTTMGFVVYYGARPLHPGAGYQFVGGQPCVRMCLQVSARADYAQRATMTWDGACLELDGRLCHWAGIAVELK